MSLRMLIPYLAVFAAALVTTLALTPLAKWIATKLGAIDYPNARRINKVPIPRMGGIAIFLGLIASLITQYVGTILFDWPSAFIPHPSMSVNYWGIAFAALVIFITGFIDDLRQLTPKQKLFGQVVAATIAAFSGLVIGQIVNPFGTGELDLGWVAIPITIIYLVSFSNIVNLIDGLDGLAAGVCAIVSFSLTVITAMSGRVDASALSIAITGACLGFLRYNFHPASIFMGDSGALLLGFTLGCVSLLGVQRTAALTTLIVPLIIAGVPIIDTFAAIIRRKRGHVPIGHADKGHIQHRLMHEGFDQRQACLVIYAWSALLSAGAFIITQVPVLPRVIVFVALLVISIVFVGKLHIFEPVLRHYQNPVTRSDEILDIDDPVFTHPLESEPSKDSESN